MGYPSWETADWNAQKAPLFLSRHNNGCEMNSLKETVLPAILCVGQHTATWASENMGESLINGEWMIPPTIPKSS